MDTKYALWKGPLPEGKFRGLIHRNDGKLVYTSQAASSYHSMLTRCYYPSHKSYADYGGSGVRVCTRWIIGNKNLSGYDCYLQDMGQPLPTYTMDRLGKHYAPDVCKWSSKTDQVRRTAKRRSKTSSQYKGVHWSGQFNKWRVRISVSYKKIHLGSFDCEHEAALAYNAAAIKYFGIDVAVLNDVPAKYVNKYTRKAA